MRRPSPTILAKLLVAYVTPTILLFALGATFAYDLMRRRLDAALGARLVSIAQVAASRVRGQYLLDMDASSSSLPLAYTYTQKELLAVKLATGVQRLYVFGLDHGSLCDTEPDVPIGRRYNELALDEHELGRVLAGEAVASVLFRGSDGVLYKAGYAPVTLGDRDRKVVAALRVEAPAAYFAELVELRTRLLTYGALLAAAVVLASFVVAARLTRPLRRLAGAAERIGRGELAAEVPHAGRDEIAVLARTLDEMRQGLRARDQRLQMMLAGIAHEVRNPLGGMELYAGILREELGGSDEALGHVRRIERELGHLKTIVSEFLDYARRPRPELAPVDLAPLCAEVGELVAAEAAEAGVTLAVQASGRVPALADAAQLRRALLNLVKNALQATARGGQVSLTTTAHPPGVRVTDTGRGIAPEELARIFEPFYTTRAQGTGLGLAFAKEILADHEGKIDVVSEVGRGTTFIVSLREG